MRKIIVLLAFCAVYFGKINGLQSQNLIRYVNPLTGTSNSKILTRWGAEGGTYPGAVAPFGFVQLTPETKTDTSRGYDYRDSLIYHFSCTRHFSGYPGGSGGMIRIMPLGPNATDQSILNGRPFSHQYEQSEPGYYRVQFDDNQTLAETSASVHTGMFRFTFASDEKPRIFISIPGKTDFESQRFVKGEFNHTLIESNIPFIEKKELNSGIILSFPEVKDHQILLKISFSDVDFSNTEKNLSTECSSWNFDAFRRANQEKWDRQLSVIEINDPSEERKTIFYTALYHSLLMPWIVSDCQGYYKGKDGKIHQAQGENQYGAFSPWDTFRSLHPLLCLLAPEGQNDMIRSVLDEFDQSGRLPKGPMTGQHIIPIITDSYAKDIRKFDQAQALRAMLTTLQRNAEKENDFAQYIQQGYVSYDFQESVTKTMEFAYDDWAVAQMAKQMSDSLVYRRYMGQSANYQKLFHAESRFFLPRKDKTFLTEPEGQGYKEGDKWIYSLFVLHDPVALVNFTGGSEPFAQRLDSALTSQLILFDNEPAFHVPYLFNFAGKPALTQKWVRTIMQNNYSATPGGLPGNDDLGSMSSWYVFSAMGFYPFCPGRPVYELGSSLFREVVIHLPNGKKWMIRSENNSEENIYVKNIRLNGKPWEDHWLNHSDILAGGEISFSMDRIPPANSGSRFGGRSETTGYSHIVASAFEIPADPVTSGQPFVLRYSVENKGSAGTTVLSLTVDGKPYQSQSVWVDALSVKKGTFECCLYPVGKRSLSLNQLPQKWVTVVPNPTSLAKSKVTTLDCPPLAKTSEPLLYTYEVKNFGGYPDTAHVAVILNNQIAIRDTVVLEPGQQKRVKHTFNPTTPGMLELKTGDVLARIKVYNTNAGSEVLHVEPLEATSEPKVPDRSGFANHGIRSIATCSASEQTGLIRFQPSSSLNMPKHTITVMAWVFADRQNNLSDLISKGDHIVIQQNNHKITFFAGGWGLGDCTVTLPPDWQNHWHHIAGVCNDRLLQLYIDGKLAGFATLDFSPNLATHSSWMIGGNEEFPGERLFHGKINHFRIFKEALSSEEILNEMSQN